MKSEGGGASSRRGFKYQDAAAAYFFATDKPGFLHQRPEYLDIENPDDFSYTIYQDDIDIMHIFEAKQRSSGSFNLSQFEDTLSKFSDKVKENKDEARAVYCHIVTNASLGRNLDSLLSDAEMLRSNTKTWTDIKDKTVYQSRGSNQIEQYANTDDGNFLQILISGLYNHQHTRTGLVDGLKNYIRECNSPGNFRTPAEKILEKVGDKDSGVVKREELEQVSDASLTREQDSSRSSSQRSMDELITDMEGIAEEYSNSEVDTRRLDEGKQTVREFTEAMIENENISEEVAESKGARLTEDIERIVDLEEEKEILEHGVGRKAKRFVRMSDDSTTDNTETSGEEI